MPLRLPKTLGAFIWHFLRPYKFFVALCIACSLAAGLWGPLNSVLIKEIINLLPHTAQLQVTAVVWWIILLLVNFLLLDNLNWRIMNYIWAKYIPVIQNTITGSMLDYALAHSHGFYQNHLSGTVSKQITNLVDSITRIVTYSSLNCFRGLALLLASFLASYSVNPVFCLIIISWFLCFASFSIWMSRKLVALSDRLAAEESHVVGELVDALSNHSNVRLFTRTGYERQRMAPFFHKQQVAYTKTYLYSMLLSGVQGVLIAIMIACSSFFLVYLYRQGLVTVGDFALILGLSMGTGHMMWYTMSEVDELNQAIGRCNQSLLALMVPLDILDHANAGVLHCRHGNIRFDNVQFHYQGAEPLFQNKSIVIHAGEKVGLVGYSGSGKSTFVHLILRLYDVDAGAIYIDGQDLRSVTQDSLRGAIAMIPQDPSLFHRSLMENIRYGRIDASDDEVIAAAKQAHAHEFIVQLPQGYHALVGERGIKLSGGQRQRIAIARAILKDARILVLDEATSQLDSVTEHLIQESLWQLMQQKTTIVIAHRLSTLSRMDRILVFHKGSIVEDGNHQALLERAGLYKQLWDAQVGGFLGDGALSC